MKPRTQAELDALYAQYPGLRESVETAAYCFPLKVERTSRAYATGLGPIAHAEAQEAGRLQDEFARGMKTAKERKYL